MHWTEPKELRSFTFVLVEHCMLEPFGTQSCCVNIKYTLWEHFPKIKSTNLFQCCQTMDMCSLEILTSQGSWAWQPPLSKNKLVYDIIQFGLDLLLLLLLICISCCCCPCSRVVLVVNSTTHSISSWQYTEESWSSTFPQSLRIASKTKGHYLHQRRC